MHSIVQLGEVEDEVVRFSSMSDFIFHVLCFSAFLDNLLRQGWNAPVLVTIMKNMNDTNYVLFR